jgi:hypothetical protein
MVYGGSGEMEGAMVKREKREKREIGFNFRVELILNRVVLFQFGLG